MNASHREVFAFEGQVDARKHVTSPGCNGGCTDGVVASVTCLVRVLEVPALKETVKLESMYCNQTQLVGPSEYKVLTNIVCKSCTNMKTLCLSL